MLTLVGDSLVDGWRHQPRSIRRVLPAETRFLGYPGRRPDVIRDCLQAGDLQQIRGTAIVMAGVNSFTVDAQPQAIARDVHELAQLVAARADTVILCAILPAIMWGRNEWPRIRDTNALLAAAVPQLEIPIAWLDLAPSFLEGDRIAAALVSDGVHLTARGYLRWGEALRTVLPLEIPRPHPFAIRLALGLDDIRHWFRAHRPAG